MLIAARPFTIVARLIRGDGSVLGAVCWGLIFALLWIVTMFLRCKQMQQSLHFGLKRQFRTGLFKGAATSIIFMFKYLLDHKSFWALVSCTSKLGDFCIVGPQMGNTLQG